MLLFLYVSLALVPRPLLHGATSVHPRAPRRPLPRLAVSDAELVRELCQREHVGRVMLLLRRLSRGYTGGQVQVWRPIFVADAFWKPLDLLVIGLLGGLLPKLASALSSVLGNKVPPEPASVIGTRGRIARALGSTLGVLYVCDSLACAVGRLWPLQAGSAARGAEILSCITISLGAVRVLTYISRRCIGSYFGMDSSDGNLIGRVAVADRTVTWLIWLVAGASCAEVISLEMGIALKSLFALGGLSSIVFALALKETAAEVLAGLIITATEPFLPGDDIECVGTRGRVERFGWYQSRVRLASGDLAFVPNSALAGKQLINHSRRIPASTTHIEASLRLRYCDLPRVEAVVEALRGELAAFPGAVRRLEPSAHLAELGERSVVVKISLEVALTGAKAVAAKQQVLLAAARVVQEQGACFECETDGPTAVPAAW